MEKHKTLKLIKNSKHLPQIPKSFGEILNMLLAPCDFNMDECIEKFSMHPQLEATLIKVLNYNSKLNREIVSIKDAVVYLGAKNTRLIAISYITRLLLPDRKGRAKIFDNSTYWKHCIGTSIASYMIADRTGLCDKDKMFIYGLIHDIGVTVLDICLPEHLDKIHMLQQKGLHQIAAEKIVLSGITHSDIGMWLCKEWGLPDEISEIVGFHHTPLLSSKNITEVEIMHLADSISTNYYEKLLGNETTFLYSEKIMEALGVNKECIDEIVDRIPQEVKKVDRVVDFKF
ncbi:HDOD domain-containing protein [Clostridium chromiireducens]|uniref:HDOD domain-containing protein n=1 Tax=Clostridium chromiireducens TaxID=225345 RepID=A0A964RT06_9CLOT|nr:HDOD domain-containing protein [Clostridium chromiireducens]MVX67247.1 HDOD domain-containing protein [Clostridium chromiireducens]